MKSQRMTKKETLNFELAMDIFREKQRINSKTRYKDIDMSSLYSF